MYRALIAEDEPSARERLLRLARWAELGFDAPLTAGDGQQALAMCLSEPIDLVITDIRMPNMDGLSLAASLKALRPGTRVMLISGYGEFAYAQRALALGIRQYLLKPVEAADFRAALSSEASALSARLTKTGISAIPPAQMRALFEWERRLPALLEGIERELPRAARELASRLGALDADAEAFILTYLEARLSLMLGERNASFVPPLGEADFCTAARCLFEAAAESLRLVRLQEMNLISSKIMAIARQEYMSSVSLKDLSKRLSMHPVYLSYAFRRETGMAFSDYLTGLRIDAARELLLDGRLSIEAVGERVGYPIAANFTRCFKRITGVSPNEYRRARRARLCDLKS